MQSYYDPQSQLQQAFASQIQTRDFADWHEQHGTLELLSEMTDVIGLLEH